MAETAIIIGSPSTCQRLERQLDLLEVRPHSLGWIVPEDASALSSEFPAILGTVADLELILAVRKPSLALVCLPGSMSSLIASIRTRIRKLGIAERFMPTLEDQLAGVGPRTHIDIDLADLLDRPARRVDESSIRGVLAGRNVLITGAGGSIGSDLARTVARFRPRKLLLVERSENALFEIDRQIARRFPELPREALLHDIVDAARTLALFHGHRPQVVFHAAAHKHVPMMEDHPGEAVDNNLFGTTSVADAADAVSAERFVMISTDKAVNPSSVMGATKRLAEIYVQHMNQRSATGFCMVRFGNVLGSTGSVLDVWSRQIAEGGPLTVTDPGMTRYFMTIPEAAALVIQAAALLEPTSKHDEVFLLDMGEPIRVVDLARRFALMHGLNAIETCQRSSHRSSKVRAGEIRVVFTGARPGEKLHEELAADGQALQPTRHPDIMIWAVESPSHGQVTRILRELAPDSRPTDPRLLANLIHGLVQNFAGALAA